MNDQKSVKKESFSIKFAWVTGASSSIGEGIVRPFAQCGAKVVTAIAAAILATSGTVVIAAAEAVADSKKSGANRLLEEIVVTARKREENAQSVPIPITAVSAEQLEYRNATNITDIEKLAPNTDIQNAVTDGTVLQVFMRGIGQLNWASTQDPKIGIYIDGVYLSRPQGALVDLIDVERVEVLRGPQGTLFGRNTTAGLVHIINNKPGLEKEFDIQVGAGSDGHQTFGFVVNYPLTDSLSSRFSLSSKETDGFIENSFNGDDYGDTDSLSYRGSLLWEQGQYSAQLSYDHFEADQKIALGSCRFNGPDDPFAAQGLLFLATIFGTYNDIKSNCENTSQDVSLHANPDDRTDTETNTFTLTQSYDLDWAEITSITARREIDNYVGSWGWVLGNGVDSNLLEILGMTTEHEISSQELRLAGSTDKFDWVVGAYISKEEGKESTFVPLFRGVQPPAPEEWPFFYAPTGALNPDGSAQKLGDLAVGTQAFGSRIQSFDVTNKNKAIFFEGTYALTNELDLTVGVRYTKDEREFTRIQTLSDGVFDPGYVCPGMPTVEVAPGVLIAASDRCTQNVEYDATTPRIILSYQLNENVMFYGSFSEGYSSGGFNQDTRMKSFKPERSDNWEVGVKSTLFDSRLRINATAFSNNYENQQIVVTRIVDGQVAADLINAQEATIEGLELEVLAQLTDSVSLSMMAGYIQGDYDKFTVEDNTFDPLTGDESTEFRDLSDLEFGNNGDEISADISLLHFQPLSFGGELISSIGVSFKDDQYYRLDNTPASKEDSYWLMDARVTWQLANGKTSIALWGTNLTDKDYVANMVDQSGDLEIGGTQPELGMSSVYWGHPRRFGVELKHSF